MSARILFLAPLLCSFALMSACTADGDSGQSANGDASTGNITDNAKAADGIERAPSGLDIAPLTIKSGDKSHIFSVEVARSPQQQARGLMFRTELAPDKGMIFPFDPPRPANFWMKNTQISLDIIFVRSDGSIESIAANTVPYSLDGVASGEPVAMVLELAAGRAAQLGLQAGDIVKWTDPRK